MNDASKQKNQPEGITQSHARSLEALRRRNRLRSLSPRKGIDFASNDYFGLANSSELAKAAQDAIARGVAIGSGGSRLLRGNTRDHEALETEAAAHFGAEAALFFGSGFAANASIFATLPQRDDLIIFDELIHASARDGMAMTRAKCEAVPHNSVDAIDTTAAAWRKEGHTGQIWIAVETIYSMDGDKAPLEDLIAVAHQHDAVLLLDEAHATGVFGPGGRGLAHAYKGHGNIISLHTCGKALGVVGALVTGPKIFMDFLINRSRAFIYATAPSPLMADLVRFSLKITSAVPTWQNNLHALVAHAATTFGTIEGIKITGTPIQPVIVGTDTRALALSQRLQAEGFDVRAIRPPTVPEGTARLRIALTLNATKDDVTALGSALQTPLKDLQA